MPWELPSASAHFTATHSQWNRFSYAFFSLILFLSQQHAFTFNFVDSSVVSPIILYIFCFGMLKLALRLEKEMGRPKNQLKFSNKKK